MNTDMSTLLLDVISQNGKVNNNLNKYHSVRIPLCYLYTAQFFIIYLYLDYIFYKRFSIAVMRELQLKCISHKAILFVAHLAHRKIGIGFMNDIIKSPPKFQIRSI